MKLLTRYIIILILLSTKLDCYSQNNTCQSFEYQKTYWNSFSNHPNAIINTSDGGNVIVGNITDFWMFNDAFIFKINAQGNVIWAKKVGTSSWDQFMNVIETADGSYLAIGQSASYGTIISKFSGTGNLLWTKLFPTLSFNLNSKLDIVELPTGGYAITCIYLSPISKALVLRIDNVGNITWAKSYYNSTSLF
jgi:hypothetical protein